MLRPMTLRVLAALSLGLLVVWPVLLVTMPPLLDYPNHLVRFWLLSGGVRSLTPFYAADWSHTTTNIGMDILGAGLARATSASTSGRIVLALAALLPCAGSLLLWRKLHGQSSGWQAFICLNAWPLTLLCGLMSFQLSLGLALIAAWLDLILIEQSPVPSLGRRGLQCLGIALVHPFGAALYFGLVLALHPDLFLKRPKWRRWSDALAPFLGAAIVLWVYGRLQSSSGAVGAGWPDFQWEDARFTTFAVRPWLAILASPWRSYNAAIDAIIPLTFVGLTALALWQRRLRVHKRLVCLGIILTFAGAFGPQDIGSTSLIDLRLLTMAGLILPIALAPVPAFRYASALIWAACLSLVAGRALWFGDIWVARQADMAALYAAMDAIPAQARVVPVMGPVTDNEPVGRYLGDLTPSFEHLPALVVLRRHAYVPTLFAETGKQPLVVRPPYDLDNEPSGGVLGTVPDLEARESKVAAYLGDWSHRYDYVLVIHANTAPPLVTSEACLIRDTTYARVYKVGHC